MFKNFVISLLLLLVLVGLASLKIETGDRSGREISQPSNVAWRQDSAETFRVDNFNIQRGKGKDGVRDLSRSIAVLKGADIVGLQETSGTLFYGLKDQAQQIAEAIGAGFLFAPTSWRWLQPYRGPALLSKFPVTSWTVSRLPRDETAQDNRLLISAEVMIAGRPARLLVTHLTRRAANPQQLEYVFDVFRTGELPTILMADLNIDDSSEKLQAFLAEPETTDAVEAAIGPFWRLDWIITRGFDVVDGGYTPRGISDHAHYWLELKFSDAADAERSLETTL